MLCISMIISCQNKNNKNNSCSKSKIEDGLYLLTGESNDTSVFGHLDTNHRIIRFNKKFADSVDQKVYLLIDRSDFVPLLLASEPDSVQMPDKKTKLLLNLTNPAGEKLKTFTAKHLNQKVVLVMNGEALTKHKVRSVISDGKIQITRCTDNACEYLYYEIKEKMKKK